MASDDKKDPGSRKGGEGRKPVTLDLEATDKRAEPAAGPERREAEPATGPKPGQSAAAPAAPKGPDAAAKPAGPQPEAPQGAGGKASAAPKPDPARDDASRKAVPSAFATSGSSRSADAAPAAGAAPASAGGTSFLTLLAAALIGGLVGAGAFWWASSAGLIGAGTGDIADVATEEQVAGLRSELESLRSQVASGSGAPDSALAERVAALESQAGETAGGSGDAALADLRAEVDSLASDVASLASAAAEGDAGQGADLSPLSDRLDQLDQRLATLEDQPAGAAPEVGEQVSAQQESLARIDERLAAVEARPEGLPQQAAEQITALQERLGTLEERVGQVSEGAVAENADAVAALRSELAETRDLASRVPELTGIIAADALAGALLSGQPFETELATARAAGIADPGLESLASYQASGVPTLPALAARFESEVLPALAPAEPETAAAGEAAAGGETEAANPWERILASARGLVEVRPADPAADAQAPGEAPERIRALLDGGDLAAALAEWRGLPDAAKAATRGWAADAEARLAAADLAGRLRADSLSRLAPKS